MILGFLVFGAVSCGASGAMLTPAAGKAGNPKVPPILLISTSALPAGIASDPYSAAVDVSGGTLYYTWSIEQGSLPAGLTLSATTGLIAGTPTVNGISSFTVAVTDSGRPAQTVQKSFSIRTVAPLSIGTSMLPAGIDGSAYAGSIQASGGTSSYNWSIASGTLPAGLALDASTGKIVGTPAGTGRSTFVVKVTDQGNPAQSASRALSMITTTPLALNASAMPSGIDGTAYNATMQASGGTPNYTWAITSGSLPAGLTLVPSTGSITGTPTAAGTSSFTATVTDQTNPAQSVSQTFSVGTASPLAIRASSLSSGTTGASYAAQMQASGGTPNYTWTITSGSLPAGLNLAAATGVLSGTPTSIGTSSFVATVTDGGSPSQSKSLAMTLAILASPLTITSSAVPVGTDGTVYSKVLQANGGTPAYTWSVTAGSLPAGLSLGATTGEISGMPSATGTSSFTATVSDNGNPVQKASATTSITVAAAQQPLGPGTTWYVRTDGGTRYSANTPYGQCDGKADTAYGGSGVNQHCAFNDFRYLWDDDSGSGGVGTWIIAGGDTVLIRGCAALSSNSNSQSNPSSPNCRIGWDRPYGDSLNKWCYGVGSYTCFSPPIPAGTSTQHTRILGQNYANCSVGGATDPSKYVSNLTQLFGGFSLTQTFNLQSTQYVDVQCIELTTHNGQCTTSGSPAYPRQCSNNQPLDDFAANGFVTDNATANVTLQDVYVHGFNSSGLYGPIGGAITMTRVNSSFNAFAGWNFADTNNTPNASGSGINAHFVTMIGNGCYEEYPIVHTGFSAQACYDDGSNGFGDAWSGQDTGMDSFICDHCVMAYNTKDAFIGPHAYIKALTITNSKSYGNMGAQWKWNNSTNATTLFANNLTIGNCVRLAQAIPGAAHTFALSSGLPGAYLSDFCRAGGNTVAINSQANSTVTFVNNTFVDYIETVFLFGCGPINNNRNGQCGTTPFIMNNNIFLSYNLTGNDPPGLIYIDDPSITVTQNYNLQYGNRARHGEVCGTNGNICADPLFVNEPVQQNWSDQTFLDNFNFKPTSSSPAVGAGAVSAGMPTADYFGITRPTPPGIGAVEP